MDTAMLWLTFLSTAAALASAVFAFVQAKTATTSRQDAQIARTDAQKARDETLSLKAKANEAFERLAAAQERATEIEEAKLPKPFVDWRVEPGSGRDTRRLVNIGTIAALAVTATGGPGVYTDEDSQSDLVVPGDSIEFAVMPRNSGTGRPRLHVEWQDSDTGDAKEWDRAVD
jgi:hypothetical protein